MNPQKNRPDPIDESLRRDFEAAWLEGKPQSIDRFLPPEDNPNFRGTLEELIHIELEFAWKRFGKEGAAGRPPHVEDYLERFPSMDAPPIVQRLVEQEYRVRRRFGDAPSIDSYRERFPDIDLKPEQGDSPSRPGLSSPLPARIAHYRVTGLLGEGGMGTVYLAEQDKPRRTVALKVIKFGYTTTVMLKRFEHEAQVLGHLQHPGIAQVFEAGLSEGEGHPIPFIAMEYVAGETLIDYCRSRDLSLEARLELAARICDAVHHAHQRGVIHRDLKPANILVTEEAGVPQPKILDFGVARVTDADMQTTTLQTDAGQLLGTLQYMSPEQASGDPAGLDMRSDVYSLGVLLYELLAGRAPYDLRGVMIHEAVRRIREEEPTSPGTLHHALQGDLSTILGKAMEKSKDRRYQSAAELAADLRRYLDDEPILAHPPSTIYQFRKFARRHRALVAASMATTIALMIGSGLALWQAVRATRAMKEARIQRDEARRQARISEKVGRFLIHDLLDAANPWQYDADTRFDKDMKVIDVFQRASQRIRESFEEEPLVAAAIHLNLGTVFTNLSDFENAEFHCLKALDLTRTELGEDAPETLSAMNKLALLYRAEGKAHEAETLQHEVLEKRRRILGEEHPDTLDSMDGMASIYSDLGRTDEAMALQEKTVTLALRLLGEEDEKTLIFRNNLAGSYWALRRYAEAEKLYLEIIAVMSRLYGAEHADTLRFRANLARLYGQMGQYEKSERLEREVLEASGKTLGEEDPDTLEIKSSLAVTYYATGRYQEAADLLEETLRQWRKHFSDEHQKTLYMGIQLACIHCKLGRLDEAEALFDRYLEPCRRILGDEHFQSMNGMISLGDLYRTQGRSEEALSVYKETLAVQQRVLGEKDVKTVITHSNLGDQYMMLERYEEAAPHLRIAWENVREVFPPSQPYVALVIFRYGSCVLEQARPKEAEPVLLEAYDAVSMATGDSRERLTREIVKTLIRMYGKLGDETSKEKWRSVLSDLGEESVPADE